MSQLKMKVEQLEEQRLQLQKKKDKVSICLAIVTLPIVIAGLWGMSKGHDFSLFLAGLAVAGAFWVYYKQVTKPFKKLLGEVKAGFIQDFMDKMHPDVIYDYQFEEKRGYELAKRIDFDYFGDSDEEDVLEGDLNGTKFYISELELTKRSNKKTITVFKGLIVNMIIPKKNFPESKIDTDRSGFLNFFNRYELDEESDIHYSTSDGDQFDEQLRVLLPFIKSIRGQSERVRVYADQEELTVVLDTDMKFMDNPKIGINNTFDNPVYADNLSRDLNTMLYMVEALSKDLSESEVEERLKLKALEYANRKA